MNAIAQGNTIGPLVCGFIVTSLSWRWHKWIAFILTAINWTIVLLLCPETRYTRPESEQSSAALSQTEQYNTNQLTDQFNQEKQVGVHQAAVEEARVGETTKKSWIQEMSLWSGIPKGSNIVLLFLRPLPLVVLPVVIFSFITYSASLAWVLAINVLNPFVLQAPPYSWKPDINGLINIPGLIGNLVGGLIGGYCVDKYCDWRSKKNNGVFQPETRLHLLLLPAIVVPAGSLLFGYGVGDRLHWTAIFFGYGMATVGLTAVPVATFAYFGDCYLPVNADALLLVNGLKNIFAFGFLYGILPWITQTGYINAFGTQAGIYVAVMLFTIPLVIFGPHIRRSTAGWRIILS
ncbi:hypothetical protein LTR78_007873 [Recurvomyces mirabilis]|uniref:Major facilitator superfamily (MFS) profile domain-containing protein n=1 Tax=Recurvomyces mirabilis TaxID=574656 RepID=A0AAE0WJ46_9PEZI|nr:hypothetical protein LTR78_007873 [Recurvomyces mirabilis]KAK5160087.1 hypothetical protein LTS14_002194 [Recurvomyces mirabilis]